jgi:hypothetical protein
MNRALSLSLSLSLSRARAYRVSDRSMSCLVSESIIENRVRDEHGGRRRKKRKGRKERRLSLLETFVERCLTGTCCWCSTPTTSTTYLSLGGMHSRPTASRPSHPLTSPSLATLRSFRGAGCFILWCASAALVCSVSSALASLPEAST